ncbi:hypothetical protein MASR2M78_32930 [Treponema sp.]
MLRALVIISILSLAACTPQSQAAGTTEKGSTQGIAETKSPPASPIPDSPIMLSPHSSVQDLAKLGFSVFPEPQDLPPFAVAGIKGGTTSISDFKGKYVFLNFWATWCPPCKKEMPSIQVLSDTLSGEDFSIFAISVGEKQETVTEFLKKNPYTFPIFLNPDNSLGSIFAGRGIPTTYIIDRRGRAIAGMIGSREWDDTETLSIFRSLLANKE